MYYVTRFVSQLRQDVELPNQGHGKWLVDDHQFTVISFEESELLVYAHISKHLLHVSIKFLELIVQETYYLSFVSSKVQFLTNITQNGAVFKTKPRLTF